MWKPVTITVLDQYEIDGKTYVKGEYVDEDGNRCVAEIEILNPEVLPPPWEWDAPGAEQPN